MKNSFIVEEHSDYLVFRIEGQDSFQYSLDYWKEIADICKQKNIFKILVIESLIGQISISEMYELCEKLSLLVLGIDIAFIDKDKTHASDNLFGETVARNRGVNIRDFDTETDALDWLLN